MIQQIHLENFAIIEHLDLDLHQGMTVFTGETGAGKSIMLDAIELALGSRLLGDVVRAGSERADISLVFNINDNSAAKSWLTERELYCDNECVVRRTISKDGRSKSYINGSPVTLQLASELGELLLNIHGQHEHQSLLKRERQRDLLDEYAGHMKLATETQILYQQWRQLKTELEQASNQNQDQHNRREYLQFQLEEFATLNLQEGEIEALSAEHKELANADSLIEFVGKSINSLAESEEQNVLDSLNQVLRWLEHYSDSNEIISNCCQLLEAGSVQIQEANSELRHYLDRLELNPDRLNEVEQRLSVIHELARKHRINPEELLNLQDQLQTELDQIDNIDEHVAKLQTQLANTEKDYFIVAKKLSQSRKKAADRLGELVSKNMHQLGMTGGQFAVNLIAEQDQEPKAHGLERIEFTVSANKGQALQALNKVASGGELSRISLAIQVIIASKVATPTLIFDEVDVGVGGKVAEIVGRLLRELANSVQVLCITHLAQVAALGQHHFRVTKQSDKTKTVSDIIKLDAAQRVDEIARMIGGIQITKQTRAHAEEMLALVGVGDGNLAMTE